MLLNELYNFLSTDKDMNTQKPTYKKTMETNSLENVISPQRPICKLRGHSIKNVQLDSNDFVVSPCLNQSENTKIHRKPGRPPKIKRGPKPKKENKNTITAFIRREQFKKVYEHWPHIIFPICCRGTRLLCKACKKYVSIKCSSLKKHLKTQHHVESSIMMYEELLAEKNPS
ncbi:hypothetical protein WA158_000529 [Blastocystis sp. Blastoise]